MLGDRCRNMVWRPRSSSVEQPAEYLSGDQSSAAQPATTYQEQSFCRFAFYNIGWQSTDKTRVAATLVSLVCTICQSKTVHAFGISEVFNIAQDNLYQRRQEVMKLILDALNVDSAGQPVWIGKADVHYIFVWNTDVLTCLLYEVISCGIEEHPERKAQYFEFVTVMCDETLHVFHTHHPSSKTKNLTIDRRKRSCTTFWRHVARKSSTAPMEVMQPRASSCTRRRWRGASQVRGPPRICTRITGRHEAAAGGCAPGPSRTCTRITSAR